MEIPENLLAFIKTEARRIHHGRIIIELNATSDKIDVITELRERFKTEDGESPGARPALGCGKIAR